MAGQIIDDKRHRFRRSRERNDEVNVDQQDRLNDYNIVSATPPMIAQVDSDQTIHDSMACVLFLGCSSFMLRKTVDKKNVLRILLCQRLKLRITSHL